MSHRRATFAFTIALAAGCTSRTFEAPAIRPAVSVRNVQTYHQNDKLDLLFMIDDSSSMDKMQTKLKEQLPLFMQVLQNTPAGLPDIHIAVVSSDMGAPSDTTIPNCTRYGDQGMFRASAEDACLNTTLAPGATFLSSGHGIANFTGQIADVFQCIALLGASGCGFENQLAAIDRALGADGQAAPAQNAGFLRDDAVLAIVLLTNEDDCSAPSNTKLYSENGSPESLANPLGPLTYGYRCNRYGHLCTDPKTGAKGVMPPLTPPPGAAGNPPIVTLTDCESNDTDSGMLTPVSKFISDIRHLKQDPENQILVAAIMAPPAPYAVTWAPGETSNHTTEDWPIVMHSCGAAGAGDVNPAATDLISDGSFGDPGVRIAQFLNGFSDSVTASICAPSYASALTAIATRINQKFAPPCLTGRIARTAAGTPDCSVTDRLFDARDGTWSEQTVPNCDETGNQTPCWRLQPAAAGSTCTGQVLTVDESDANKAADTIQRSADCSVCTPASDQPGCD